MNNNHEQILVALFTLLKNSVVVNFTATGTNGSPTLTSVSSVKGFFVGLPMFGPGVPQFASILSWDATAMTVTLDQNLTQDAPALSAFNTGFQTASRRLKFWTEVAAQPAIFLRHTKDTDEYNQTIMQKTSLECEVWIYSNYGANPDVAADTQLNNLVTAVRTALASDVRGYPQTLAAYNGGVPLVQWVRVEGDTEFDPGDLDNYAKALIPIKILCP